MEYAERSCLHYLEKTGKVKHDSINDTFRTSNWALPSDARVDIQYKATYNTSETYAAFFKYPYLNPSSFPTT
jgi:hypothetical protein